MATVKFKPLTPRVVLGVAAHPDDLDFGAAGTLAKWAEAGADVHYLILTDGSKGSANRELAPKKLSKVRQKEQKAAAEAIGVRDVTFCHWEDCCLECNNGVKAEIVKAIRKLKPDIVITMDPTVSYVAEFGFINHPDHRAAGQATLDAVYPMARDHLSFPKLLEAGLEPHPVPTVLLINLDKQNWYEDVSKQMDKKLMALKAHQSQFPEFSQTMKMTKDIAKTTGKKAKYKYAEGFMRIDIR